MYTGANFGFVPTYNYRRESGAFHVVRVSYTYTYAPTLLRGYNRAPTVNTARSILFPFPRPKFNASPTSQLSLSRRVGGPRRLYGFIREFRSSRDKLRIYWASGRIWRTASWHERGRVGEVKREEVLYGYRLERESHVCPSIRSYKITNQIRLY